MPMRVLYVALLAARAAGHGAMVWPSSWFDAGGLVGLTAGGMCAAGDPGACMWFMNDTRAEGPRTLPPEMQTYWDYHGGDAFAANPWRAPGTARVDSPCGVAGGNIRGCPAGGAPGACPGGGFGYGPRAGSTTFTDVQTAEWRRGGTAEVGWGVTANHGGGYSYRLCRKPAAPGEVVTEECFQQTPLAFHGDTQWVQYGADPAQRVSFKARRTRQGTHPAGSQWTQNPIPACNRTDGGAYDAAAFCPDGAGTQFPPPGVALFGFGTSLVPGAQVGFRFTVMDAVQVPDVPEGEYVLSFRWDCEQTPQVWNTCADVRIVQE